MEKLIIRNFAGIDKLEIDINSINVIVGPQASGKSITAKLLFYCKSFFAHLRQGIADNKSKADIDKAHLNKFIEYFPKHTWTDKEFSIKYRINDTELIISSGKNKKKSNSAIPII